MGCYVVLLCYYWYASTAKSGRCGGRRPPKPIESVSVNTSCPPSHGPAPLTPLSLPLGYCAVLDCPLPPQASSTASMVCNEYPFPGLSWKSLEISSGSISESQLQHLLPETLSPDAALCYCVDSLQTLFCLCCC
jgi:hypothetical protein